MTAMITTLRLDSSNWTQLEKQLRQADADEKSSDQGKRLCCAACGWPITTEHQRIAVRGRHQHRFRNPHGLVFEIGCFAAASGCGHAGEATEEWTWFAGYSWQIAVCGGCGAHLGWRYRNRAGEGFYGLILKNLAPEQRH